MDLYVLDTDTITDELDHEPNPDHVNEHYSEEPLMSAFTQTSNGRLQGNTSLERNTFCWDWFWI